MRHWYHQREKTVIVVFLLILIFNYMYRQKLMFAFHAWRDIAILKLKHGTRIWKPQVLR